MAAVGKLMLHCCSFYSLKNMCEEKTHFPHHFPSVRRRTRRCVWWKSWAGGRVRGGVGRGAALTPAAAAEPPACQPRRELLCPRS